VRVRFGNARAALVAEACGKVQKGRRGVAATADDQIHIEQLEISARGKTIRKIRFRLYRCEFERVALG
jgi:hypothetical protein